MKNILDKLICEFKEFLLNLFFPDKCMFCDDVIPKGYGKWICPYCAELSKISLDDTKPVLYLYEYGGYIRGMLHRFKFYNYKEYALKLGELLSERLKAAQKDDFDLIVPVPMYYKKQIKRGYNQAELLAVEISNCLKIPFNSTSLVRNVYTKAQSLMKMQDKAKNVMNVFEVLNAEDIRNKRIILVDDIFTSGSTAKSCSIKLMEAGAKEICVIVVAIAKCNV